MKKVFILLLLIHIGLVLGAAAHQTKQTTNKRHKKTTQPAKLITGADRTELYVDYLKNKHIGMVVNQTSVIGKNLVSSVDSLTRLGIHITKIFGPEHGFRGNASNGASVDDAIDSKTGIPVISLYGKHYKPTPADLQGLRPGDI